MSAQKTDLRAFLEYIDELSVQPTSKPQPTESHKPALLNPAFWMVFLSICCMLGMLYSGTPRIYYEPLLFAALFSAIFALVAILHHDSIVIHIYRLTVTTKHSAPARISPLRKAQIALGVVKV